MIVDVLGLLGVGDLRHDATVGGLEQLVTGTERATDEVAPVGVDDLAVQVPELDPDDTGRVELLARSREVLP